MKFQKTQKNLNDALAFLFSYDFAGTTLSCDSAKNSDRQPDDGRSTIVFSKIPKHNIFLNTTAAGLPKN